VAVPTIGDGEYNKKIFRRREEKDTLDCAVMLVVDASGSMDGEKYIHACHSAILLNDVFSRALRIPVEIHAFTTGGRHGKNVIGIIKDFSSKTASDDVRTRFEDFSRYMSGNGDPDAVLVALRRLLTREEKRRVMIVLSDGSPSFATQGHPGVGLKSMVKEVTSKGIELYGIGLQSPAVHNFYPSSLQIADSSELEPTLIKLLSKIILSE
jgi:cobaltochelatase CobT